MAFRVGLLALLCASLAACGFRRQETAALRDTDPAAELKFSITDTRGTTDDLVLDGFVFDGSAVDRKTLHVKTPAAGIHEITAEAPSIGEWVFAIRDLSNYYGFGERFDRLDHVHSDSQERKPGTPCGVEGKRHL